MNELTIYQDTQLEPRVYVLPGGITIDSNNVTLDGRGATIVGTDKTASKGIRISGRKNITIRNLRILNYYHGISIKKSVGVKIRDCTITFNHGNPIEYSVPGYLETCRSGVWRRDFSGR